MIKKINFNDLYVSEHGWLNSHFHFSFAEYFNPKNMNYWVLRVMNDDIVQAHEWFWMHPHRDMEIFTYVLDWEITHWDSMWNSESLWRWDIQYLSAWTGIFHSEMNNSDKPLRFIQTWIVPEKTWLKPNYGSLRIAKEDRLNKWLHLLWRQDSEAKIFFYQDSNVYVTEIENWKNLNFNIWNDRQVYLKVMEWTIKLNNEELNHWDAAEITDENLIEITAKEDSHIMLIEMEKDYSNILD